MSTPIYVDIQGTEYYNCPIKFIPETVFDWYTEYSYYHNFHTTPGAYHEINAKWLEASVYYQSMYNAYVEELADLKSRKSGRNTMAPLMATVQGRKHNG